MSPATNENVDLGTDRVTALGGVGGDDLGNCGPPGGAGSVGRITIDGNTNSGTSHPLQYVLP